jgi:transcriptional regulator with XRE-family HTH domain
LLHAADAIAATVALGERVRRLRTERGLSEQELAERCGFPNPSTVGSVEQGRHEPRLLTILGLCRGLEVSLDQLAGGLLPSREEEAK